ELCAVLTRHSAPTSAPKPVVSPPHRVAASSPMRDDATMGEPASPLPRGCKVVVHELGESPLEAVERHTSLVPMDAPDLSTLAPDDVIVAVKSASVGWVDLLMTSGQYQHLAKPPYVPGLES